ncbi:type 1 glutamine amidotransferase [Streptomyces sp. NPDC052023]|uniref:type 1 glutamine amidotransferase n=1 Tax=Streptomyces sp. NPDC052023 TaxID=3365681 RepID=UPI0037D0518D
MSDRPWHVLQHVPFEGPALLSGAAAEAGAELKVHHLWDGDPVPGLRDTGGLIVLGGPMNALDDRRHPHLAAERRLLRQALRERVPVLGVCLGAQLLAAAAGADVTQGPEPEIGPGSVSLEAAAQDDPLFHGLGPRTPVFHWHQDTFTLPEGALLLASSGRYPNQAFRLGPRAWGLQFHIEVDAAAVEGFGHLLPESTRPSEEEIDAIAAVGGVVLPRLFHSTQAI